VNKPSVKQMDIAHKMMCHWSSTADTALREKWYKCHMAFWIKNNEPMASLRWPAFDLDIVSFRIPDELPSPEEIEAWTSQQKLMLGTIENGEPAIMAEKQAPAGTLANIPEIVDAFLEGQWTPPWHCAMCRKRFNGNAKPL